MCDKLIRCNNSTKNVRIICGVVVVMTRVSCFLRLLPLSLVLRVDCLFIPQLVRAFRQRIRQPYVQFSFQLAQLSQPPVGSSMEKY